MMSTLGPRISRRLNYGNPVNWNAPLNRGLMSWWMNLPQMRGSSLWRDLTHKYHGTLVNEPIWTGKGNPGGYGALKFDGTNDRVDTPVLAEIAGSIARSISFWVNCSSAHTGVGCFLSGGVVGGQTQNDLIWNYPNTDDIYWGFGANDYATTSPPVIRDTWQYVTVTFAGGATSSTNVLFYIDGSQVASYAAFGSGTPNTTATSWGIAVQTNFGTDFRPTNGMMNDIRFYTRGLSATEVAQLYLVSRTGYQRELKWLDPIPFMPTAAAVTTFIPLISDGELVSPSALIGRGLIHT